MTCPIMPETLHITDIHGTWPAPGFDTGGSGYYITGPLCAASQTPVASCVAGVPTCHSGSQSGQPLYWYEVVCQGAGVMRINRYIGDLPCSGFTPRSQYVPCGCVTGVDTAQQLMIAWAQFSVTCGSIAWSGQLTEITQWDLQDPVGGTVTLSQ